MGDHKPIRECVLCREKCEKSELLRVVKGADRIYIDKTQKANGRGAYICKACILDPNLLKKRALDRAFRQKVSDEVYKELMSENE